MKQLTCQALLRCLCEVFSTRIAGQPCWKCGYRKITTKWMETMFNSCNVRGIYSLLNPVKGLGATITSINNDVLIASAREIVICKDNK